MADASRSWRYSPRLLSSGIGDALRDRPAGASRLVDEVPRINAEEERHDEADERDDLQRAGDDELPFSPLAQVHGHDQAEVEEHRDGGHQHGDDGQPSEAGFHG